MEFSTVRINIPEGANLVLGQSHFIKTVEDIYELLVTTVPGAKFGLAFAEASGPCLVRHEGTDPKMVTAAIDACMRIGAGHTFIIILSNAYPINFLNGLKCIQEVCSIYCATANPVEVVVCQTDLGRGIMGVVDGQSPKGVEDDAARMDRQSFLKKIGYKC
jgi:adenosine/AMP kinase